jgi:hypothetical protein
MVYLYPPLSVLIRDWVTAMRCTIGVRSSAESVSKRLYLEKDW